MHGMKYHALLLLLLPSICAAQKTEPVQVFVLAGQSNMEGKGFPQPVAWQVGQPEYRDRWTHFIQEGDHGAFRAKYEASIAADPRRPEFAWSERADVWVDFLDKRGPLTVGYGVPDKGFGPEYEFGTVVGDHLDAQVLIIKTAWGGKSLGRDFLSPSAPQPTAEELSEMVATENERVRKHNEKNPDRPRSEVTAEEVRARYGHYYREMLRHVRETLADLESFPGYAGQGHEVAGFAWFQGWNDQFDPLFYGGYRRNMEAFVRDVRKDLGVPDLPFVVGVVGFGGPDNEPNDKDGNPTSRTQIQRAQAAMADVFPGTAAAVETAPYWDMDADAIYNGPGSWKADVDKWRQFGNDRPYHYLGSPWFFAQTGRGLGQAMVGLLEGGA
jgi:hypothetical protein